MAQPKHHVIIQWIDNKKTAMSTVLVERQKMKTVLLIIFSKLCRFRSELFSENYDFNGLVVQVPQTLKELFSHIWHCVEGAMTILRHSPLQPSPLDTEQTAILKKRRRTNSKEYELCSRQSPTVKLSQGLQNIDQLEGLITHLATTTLSSSWLIMLALRLCQQ